MNLFNFLGDETLILRDYQELAIQQARESIAVNKHIVLQLSTGAGKTCIATKMLQDASAKGFRCAFVVDRLALVDQASTVFGKFGLSHGVIQGDHPLYDPDENVQICSIQTLAKRKYKKFDFVIIDEVQSFFAEHEALVNESKFSIGLSATPWRVGLGKHFNDLVIPITMRELIEKKHLADYDCYAPSTIDVQGLKEVAGDFKESELSERADKARIIGDIVTHWKKYAEGRKTICFCVNVAHGRHVAREFNRQGIEAVEVNGYMDNDGGESERSLVMDAFVNGSAQVICSVDILGKGFDCPDVSCAILARPTKSAAIHVQQIGRALRVGGGFERSLILDHAGNFHRLGFPEDIYRDLDNGNKERGKARKAKEREEPKPKPCPSCDFLKPIGIKECPACGLVSQHIEDIDVEVGELQALKKKKKDRKEYDVMEKQMFLGGLNSYAKSKGMSQHNKGFYGWALYRYSDKFGCKPSSSMDWAYQCGITQDVENFITHGHIKYAFGSKKENL